MRPAMEEHMMLCLLLMKSLNLQFSYIKVSMDFPLFFCLFGFGFLLACSQAAEQVVPSSQVGWCFCQAGNFFHLQENLQKYKN